MVFSTLDRKWNCFGVFCSVYFFTMCLQTLKRKHEVVMNTLALINLNTLVPLQLFWYFRSVHAIPKKEEKDKKLLCYIWSQNFDCL